MRSSDDWEQIGTFGDVNPIEYGGGFVFTPRAGVEPEAEYIEPPTDPDAPGARWRVYRFGLKRCTFENGILSDNQFHPGHPAWFAEPETGRTLRPQDNTYLSCIADWVGATCAELIQLLCSLDPLERCAAYVDIGNYHGWEELDHYPLELSKAEIEERYRCK